jgi:hypothetical protein
MDTGLADANLEKNIFLEQVMIPVRFTVLLRSLWYNKLLYILKINKEVSNISYLSKELLGRQVFLLGLYFYVVVSVSLPTVPW